MASSKLGSEVTDLKFNANSLGLQLSCAYLIARDLDACCKTKIRNAKTHLSTEQVCIKLVCISSQADSCVLLFRGVRSMCDSVTRPEVRFEQGSGRVAIDGDGKSEVNRSWAGCTLI
jgi:hypothetical protein